MRLRIPKAFKRIEIHVWLCVKLSLFCLILTELEYADIFY
jgi:hypothetical protein